MLFVGSVTKKKDKLSFGACLGTVIGCQWLHNRLRVNMCFLAACNLGCNSLSDFFFLSCFASYIVDAAAAAAAGYMLG